jgi:flagellar biogenesis protein FliO
MATIFHEFWPTLQLIAAAAVVAALLIGLKYLLSKLTLSRNLFGEQQIHVIETRMVDQKTRLVLAKVDGERVVLLLGATNHCLLHLPETHVSSSQ